MKFANPALNLVQFYSCLAGLPNRDTQYMANKRDKFNKNFCLAADSKCLILNVFLYLGKNLHRLQKQSLSEYVVMELTLRFLNKSRSIMCDNVCTCMKLATALCAEKKTVSLEQ